MEIANAHLTDKGYILLEFLQENVTLSKNEVVYGWELVRGIDPLKKYPVFLKTAKWSLIDKEARIFVISEIRSRPSVAILVHNLGQKLMGNFAVKLTGNSKNIRIFESESEAISWLVKKTK
ncbi:MAG: hypothetical protein PSX36_15775 [bacterium]|nr:hypothetical protein [bacterium]